MGKVRKSFDHQNDTQLLAMGEKIESCIPNSPLFDNIYPAVEIFKTNLNKYRVKLAAAADGGKLAVTAKNEARKELIHSLLLWASYIEDHADSNDSSILATGFELAKKPIQGTAPNIPENVRLSDGKLTGEAVVRCKGVDNATAYEIRWKKEGDEMWQAIELVFKVTTSLHGITPGTVIWVQMRAINTHGTSNWSDPATMMVR
ncbi:MAG: fibronectin type III domain-containing protein [Chitinophagales bacterium]|jgi:hypothetical protein|nr:fibronectin type III domain-containing protein [Chitinophagales bacterium]HNI44938.1 fibronectin type III domain-containing protein [Chitinophagales bacterium]